MKTLLAFVVALAGLSSGHAATKAAADLLIHDATLIDVAAGKSRPISPLPSAGTPFSRWGPPPR